MMIDSDFIVTFADVNACGFCSKGAREWFKSQGLDYLDFVKNGIKAEVLMAKNDALALRAVEKARRREEENGR